MRLRPEPLLALVGGALKAAGIETLAALGARLALFERGSGRLLAATSGERIVQ